VCGLTGLFDPSCSVGGSDLQAIVSRMAETLGHRGPDDGGEWVDPREGIALGHRRLSILDLSTEGHQPMHSSCRRYVVIFNGEIYNHLEIRRVLDEELDHAWRGRSDTEVLLEAICRWGVKEAVKRLNGMFAFALWDRKNRTLSLVRDRLGEKPLYYGWSRGEFLFGSELKALCAHPSFKREIDRDVLVLFLRFGYVPAPYSIYQGIRKLPPGTILTLRSEETNPRPLPVSYWSARKVAEQGVAHPFTGSEDDAICQLETLLRDAVKLRMVADVPLGTFLSGGIDSSIVVALMQTQSDQPVKTFTIGSCTDDYNEAEHAKRVAKHLGTEHTELYVSPEDVIRVIPRLPTLYDEPFSDSSQIPTHLVSELARRHVTVSLSGDGGDELFGGYIRYLFGSSIWAKFGWVPQGLREMMAGGLAMISPQRWDQVFNTVGLILPSKLRQRMPGVKLHKLAEVINAESPDEMYYGLVSHWKHPASFVLGASEPKTVLSDRKQWPDLADFTQRMMFLDTVTYLPDDILVKLDRASMGVSLEARVPLLDHRVVEFSWRMPLSMKIRDGQGKWLLRQVLYKYVPKKLIDRPKTGFAIPIDDWLRGPLREWAESLLDEGRLRREGFFNPEPIRTKWAEHLSGKYNLMFQAWNEQWK